MTGSTGPTDVERLNLRQIIADIDQKRIDAELKRAQLPQEDRCYMLQLAATMAGAFVAGGTIVAALAAFLAWWLR